MTAFSAQDVRTRGACPRLAAPMETGDGLLARIVPSGPIAIDAFAALCAAAQTHGNGLMEITARGSVQVRGLDRASAPQFAASVEALDIGYDNDVPVLATPLPHAPSAPIRAQDLAAEIRAAIVQRDFVSVHKSLAPKVSVIVDDGGAISLDTLAADIRLRAVEHESPAKILVMIGNDGALGSPLGLAAPENAPQLVCDLLQVIAARGTDARARDILREEGLEPFMSAARSTLEPTPPIPTPRQSETIGLHKLHDGQCAIGISLPFGQTQALDLIALLRIARANGAAWVATAPQRTLLLGPISEMTAFALGTAADTLGFVVDARDARRRVVACAGAPACTSGLIPARSLAAEIASRLGQGKMAVHVSGCAKGCAHHHPAPLTIVGTAQGAAFVRDGTARTLPEPPVPLRDIVAEAVRLIDNESTDA